jgi:hypothetical protein
MSERMSIGGSSDKNLANFPSYFKRLCVLLRTIKALSVTLPSYKFMQRLLKPTHTSSNLRSEIKVVVDSIKTDYQMNFKKEKIDNEFFDEDKVIRKNLYTISN